MARISRRPRRQNAGNLLSPQFNYLFCGDLAVVLPASPDKAVRIYPDAAPLQNLLIDSYTLGPRPNIQIRTRIMPGHPSDEKSDQDWEEGIDQAIWMSLAAAYVPGCGAEKRLLRKLDFHIIVRCHYVFESMRRDMLLTISNISHAAGYSL